MITQPLLTKTSLLQPTDKSISFPNSRDVQLDKVKLTELKNIKLVGFPESHLLKMASVAKDTNAVFGIRPVDPKNKTLLEEGYPTKDLNIKPKSANWGPMSGFIPVDQNFSKLEAHSDNAKGLVAIDKSNIKVAQCLEAQHAKAGILSISLDRIDELVFESAGMEKTVNSDGSISLLSTSPSGKSYYFEARENTETKKFDIFQHGEPFNVLCDVNYKDGQALTADYDLLLVSPKIDDYGADDHAKLVDTPQTELHLHTKRFSVPSIVIENEAPKGFISSRVGNLGDKINSALGREDNKLVHHGADELNPYTDADANFPATFFLPEPIAGFGTVVEGTQGAIAIIEKHEMAEFVQKLKDANFHVNVNKDWGDDVTSVRRHSFQDSLSVFTGGF